MKKGFSLIMLFATACTLGTAYAALSEEEMTAKAKEAVGRAVKDGESMRFNVLSVKPMPKDPESFIVCGEVNAKNSYGAYSGFQRFAYSFLDKTPMVRLEEGGRSAQIMLDAFCPKQ